MKTRFPVSIAFSSALLTACMTTGNYQSDVDSLDQRYTSLKQSLDVEEYAPVATKRAEEAIHELSRMVDKGAEETNIKHQIYVAGKRLDIAEEAAKLKQSERFVENAETKRNQILLNANREELKDARMKAQQAKQQAEAATAYAMQMRDRATDLEGQVKNLKAEETKRGLVLTLDDILFEFDSTELRAGAERTLTQVARFLNEYPERSVMIEGFTDSVGSEEYNRELSEKRAQAVKQELVDSGMKGQRIKTRGYGEEYPVATNDSEAGRQENRRVEIIISDKENQPVKERTAINS